jgi:predicted alpha/beta hydrolase family esterase
MMEARSGDDGAGALLLLIVPGLGGSGADHWQSLWRKRFPRYARVVQRDWENPELETWLTALAAAIRGQRGQVVLVAHSLGCVLVAQAARRYPDLPVRAALLVAPADVDSPVHTPEALRGFGPVPRDPLPFPATVVASQNDPYVTLERARGFAESWGADFVDAGALGHINAASGLGDWPDGRRALADLVERAGA